MKTKKFCLTENQMPAQWYNIVADMPNKPLPPLHPATKQPVTTEQMSAIFAEELIDQEMSAERFIDIPEEVQEIDKMVVSLVKRQHEKAIQILKDNRKALDALAKYLYEKETITGEEFMHVLKQETEAEKQ